MTTFLAKENVMKNQEQPNNINNLNDPTIANDPQAQVEFEDLPISGEQEELVKGGAPALSSPLTGTSGEQMGESYSNRFSCLPSALPPTGTSGELTGAITTRRS
jgi:hypothetical protein